MIGVFAGLMAGGLGFVIYIFWDTGSGWFVVLIGLGFSQWMFRVIWQLLLRSG